MNERSYHELGNLLKGLGIEDITETQIQTLETTWNEYPEEIMSKGSLNKLTLLLTEIGQGTYDFKTATWTATSNHVFSFDMEAFDIENMYARLLKGIEHISSGELHFENIEEMSNSEIGIGNQVISFDLNGNHHDFQARINFDWYDVNVIPFLNQLTKEDKPSKQLLFLTDGYQECIVFYNTEAWAKDFEMQTGLTLYK